MGAGAWRGPKELGSGGSFDQSSSRLVRQLVLRSVNRSISLGQDREPCLFRFMSVADFLATIGWKIYSKYQDRFTVGGSCCCWRIALTLEILVWVEVLLLLLFLLLFLFPTIKREISPRNCHDGRTNQWTYRQTDGRADKVNGDVRGQAHV